MEPIYPIGAAEESGHHDFECLSKSTRHGEYGSKAIFIASRAKQLSQSFFQKAALVRSKQMWRLTEQAYRHFPD